MQPGYYAPPPQPPYGGPPPKKSRINLFIGIAIGVVVTIAAVMAFGWYMVNRNVDEMKERFGPASESHSATNAQYPAKLSAASASGDQFANRDPSYPFQYSRQEQLDYAATKLNDDAQAAADRARVILGNSSNLTEDDGTTTRKIAKPDLANTPQQILDQFAVGTFQAWEAAHNGNVDEAKKLAVATADLQYSEYQDQVDAFSENTPTLAEGVAWGDKPLISSGGYDGVSATAENPVITFNKTSASNTNDRVRLIFRFEKGTTEDSSRWVLVKTTGLS
jgi:hypothetical protein